MNRSCRHAGEFPLEQHSLADSSVVGIRGTELWRQDRPDIGIA
jgi:hypothetical protein